MPPIVGDIWQEGHFRAAVPASPSLCPLRTTFPGFVSLPWKPPSRLPHRGCHPRVNPSGRSRRRPCRAHRCSRLQPATPTGKACMPAAATAANPFRPAPVNKVYVSGVKRKKATTRVTPPTPPPIAPARATPRIPAEDAATAAPKVFDKMGSRYDTLISSSCFTFLH